MDVATEENPPSPPAKRRHPDVQKGKRGFVPVDADWTGIRQDYCQKALSVKELAVKYGVNPHTIYKRSVREQWPIPKRVVKDRINRIAKLSVSQKVRETMQKVTPALEGAIREWQERTIGLAGVAREKVAEKLSGELEAEELKTVVSALDTADRVGRRSLGLDKESAGAPAGAGTILHMRLELLGLAGSPLPTGPTVEIQALTESAQEGADVPASPV